MATFNSRFLYSATSPRNPRLIVDYIKVAQQAGFDGKEYNQDLQANFYDTLSAQEVAGQSAGKAKDKALAGRDKLTRSPQYLGFFITQSKKPFKITEAAKLLTDSALFEDVLLHQLLKFQLPSKLHKEGPENAGRFNIKPFLELIRLINTMGYITYQEFVLYGMTLTDYHNFDDAVARIKQFRVEREAARKAKKSLKVFFADKQTELFDNLYADLIKAEQFKTRESKDASYKKFKRTKMNNWRDYSDAYFRALRETGLIVMTQGRSMQISPVRQREVDYILETIPREIMPVNIKRDVFDEWITNPTLPHLLNDNPAELRQQLIGEGVQVTETDNLYDMKRELAAARAKRKRELVANQVKELKQRNQQDIDDILEMYQLISDDEVVDRSTMYEWNTWRAMTMINHGDIEGNFKLDDEGMPSSVASGGGGDIVGHYGDFNIAVEVTLSTGKKQYDMESEPVTRHVGELQSKLGKPTFGIFVADKLNDNVVDHFWTTSVLKHNVYNGRVTVIPMDTNTFIEFFKRAVARDVQPSELQAIGEYAQRRARETMIDDDTEEVWHQDVVNYLLETVN